MKIAKLIAPYLYLLMVFFVVYHNTNYEIKLMFRVPYILYIVLATVSFFVIQYIIRQETDENS